MKSGERREKGSKLKGLLVLLAVVVLFINLAVGLFFLVNRESIKTALEAPAGGRKVAKSKAEEYEYFCPMHPQVIQDTPGNCPICGMVLSRRKKIKVGEAEGAITPAIQMVQLSPDKIKAIGVKTVEVRMRPLVKEIRTVGRITYDERLLTCVSAWVPGRIDKLFVDFTGIEVKKGAPLVWLYSPALYSAQQEYLLALETREKVKDSPIKEAVEGAQALVLAAKERLLLWGITQEQIKELEREKKAQTHMTIYSPAGGTVIEKKAIEGMYVKEGTEIYTIAPLDALWMLAGIYEYEMGWLSLGQEVVITSAAYPGETFRGTISFIDPFLDESTRSVKVRVDVPNPEGKLKPDMFVNAVLRIPLRAKTNFEAVEAEYTCPMHPAVTSAEPGRCPECGMNLVEKEASPAGKVLTIPKSAVLDTGLRQIVYVEEGQGTFVRREVKLGQEAQGYFKVLSGLSRGEWVVASGAFLIDAEAELSPSVSIQYFGAEEKKAPAHSH